MKPIQLVSFARSKLLGGASSWESCVHPEIAVLALMSSRFALNFAPQVGIAMKARRGEERVSVEGDDTSSVRYQYARQSEWLLMK